MVCPSVICSRSIRGAPWDSAWSLGAEMFLTFCSWSTHGPSNWRSAEELNSHYKICKSVAWGKAVKASCITSGNLNVSLRHYLKKKITCINGLKKEHFFLLQKRYFSVYHCHLVVTLRTVFNHTKRLHGVPNCYPTIYLMLISTYLLSLPTVDIRWQEFPSNRSKITLQNKMVG